MFHFHWQTGSTTKSFAFVFKCYRKRSKLKALNTYQSYKRYSLQLLSGKEKRTNQRSTELSGSKRILRLIFHAIARKTRSDENQLRSPLLISSRQADNLVKLLPLAIISLPAVWRCWTKSANPRFCSRLLSLIFTGRCFEKKQSVPKLNIESSVASFTE